MNALRWILGIVTGLTAGGWIVLGIWANGFRRSFGASENAAWKIVVPLLVMIALLASLLAPTQRGLMHTVAVAVVLLVVGCLWLVQKAPFLSLMGLIYFGLWLTYYWQAVWSRNVPNP